MWKCVHGAAPVYLQELCVPVEDIRGCPRLRSASTRCIQLPRVRTSTGQQSFAFQGPSVWNSLPSTLLDSTLSTTAFKGRLNCIFRSWTITNIIRRCRGICDRGAVYKCSDLLTYLLRIQIRDKVIHAQQSVVDRLKSFTASALATLKGRYF